MNKKQTDASLKLSSLKIKNYRSLRNVDISQMGKINLITGNNNVGKTSLLECIRLWNAEHHFTAMRDILDLRDESCISNVLPNITQDYDREWLGALSLFSDYPETYEEPEPILICGEKSKIEISIYDEMPTSESVQHALNNTGEEHFYENRFLRLHISPSDQSKKVPLFGRYASHPRIPMQEPGVRERCPCLFLSCTRLNGSGSHSVSELWDKIVLGPKEDIVIEGLKLIDPKIQRVSFRGIVSEGKRIPIVQLKHIEKPIPMQNLGDGVTRVFEIMLALVNAENGFLLIDEFENGLHYSIQEKAWEAILILAKKLNIQIFATTHSSDCVDAFHKVAKKQEDDREAVVIRMLRDKDGVYSESVFGDKLARRIDLGRELR